MENQNDSIWPRLLISCGVMLLVATICITGFIVASSVYLFVANG